MRAAKFHAPNGGADIARAGTAIEIKHASVNPTGGMFIIAAYKNCSLLSQPVATKRGIFAAESLASHRHDLTFNIRVQILAAASSSSKSTISFSCVRNQRSIRVRAKI